MPIIVTAHLKGKNEFHSLFWLIQSKLKNKKYQIELVPQYRVNTIFHKKRVGGVGER